MRIIFAWASVALLAAIVWLIKVDYARPWRRFQNDSADLRASLAYFDVLATRTREREEALTAARAAVDAATGNRGGAAEARRALAELEKQRTDTLKRYEDLSSTVRRGLFNLPLLDFAAPAGTSGHNEIRQVILPGVRRELNFVQTDTIDRCMTCHVAIADDDFTRANLARRLEKAIFSINEHLRGEGKPELTHPRVFKDRGDLMPGDIARSWQTLTAAQRDAFFDTVVERINAFQSMRNGRPLRFELPLSAHPDLDLFVSPDSPHPVNKMGCTVCHEGNGEETDFVLAGHTPPTRAVRDEWKEKYYVRSAGLAPEHTFETAREGWDRPMLRAKYLEASCTKCHAEVADIALYDGRPAATGINEGRFLFTSLGCANCHLAEGFAGSARVGPELTHLGGKLTRGFTQNWIRRPKEYRPSTYMPHFFGQENNDALSETAGGGDPELRTKTEVIAITEYLFAVGEGYDRRAPPAELWEPLRDEKSEAAIASAERGRRLFDTVGCLGCHGVLAHRPDEPDGTAGEPLGATWIAGDLASKMLPADDEAHDAIWEKAYDRYDEMTHVDRVEYAMRNFRSEWDTTLDTGHVQGPIFIRFAPELSSIRTKFDSYGQAVEWLYDWLKNPRRYASDAKMPQMQLKRSPFAAADRESGAPTGETPDADGKTVDADEALDLAIYLAVFNWNKTFSTAPLGKNDEDPKNFAARRDELIRTLLSDSDAVTYAEAVLNDEGGALTERLVSPLAASRGGPAARATIEAMALGRRRWMFLGQQMVGHYGCGSCHLIPGFEAAPRPGPELTRWAEKELSQLDFGLFDPVGRARRANGPRFSHLYPQTTDDRKDRLSRRMLTRWAGTNPRARIERTRASFAWHKVRNPRIWDRGRTKAPYDKLKMPNFFVTDEQADALVTFLLSRRPARVSTALQVDYDNTVVGRIAVGRNLARELNCMGCHVIEGNAAAIHPYYWAYEGGDLVFDEARAPPWLRAEGSRVKPAWLFGYLHDIEPIRPWLRVRMPAFQLTDEQATQLVEYIVGVSQHESQWLADRLTAVGRYIIEAGEQTGGPDWHQQDSLSGIADSLRRWASANRVLPAHRLDPRQVDAQVFTAAHEEILAEADFLSEVMAVTYPFTETPRASAPPDAVADGETLFTELQCLQCHVFGDPTVPGANAHPTAPNLQRTDRRLRREWVRRWLAGPRRILPGTRMPNFFGEGQTSAVAAYSPDDRAKVRARLNDKTIIDDGPRQIQAITSFLYDASEKRLNKLQRPPVQQTRPGELVDAKDESRHSRPEPAGDSFGFAIRHGNQ